ncbi:MAG: aminomethyl-transferring glycine dehydrogenase subunit GcvPA [Chloracidobacterium sp.]|nr:aminomethyl-transferring glycine dehydrogenase subunit GcvPA [Chloracidobacterium sp.]MBK7804543.1 aminomethyl-transferring glycine dehydrogenase subunit GcvPA [Chloracidobacterium sp.]MBK9768847.1 aminomethyl-transferring glycine dehydrogenase subunit GcvPA [Chloracidobacterium sp.]MBL0240467.1 aminomethyl-transferring glycine dehydrogenase subunit GcvPA [Chloracidobacterium sp.]MBP9935308.1 aminomethyl-transferring glycine dehydrogenase subunit GcvPA [Pyrinomonadaceae bacterium]
MPMRYIPNSPEERDEMLATVGLSSAKDLFRSIPEDVQLNRALDVTEPLAESEVIAAMEAMAAKNTGISKPSFLGGGVYSHYSPTVVDHLIQRSEFFTSYTPYQPEISQGTLQYIFEFQTLVCQLTGMEVSNASMYDGSTAMAEAYLMAQRVTRRDKIVVAKSVHKEYREVATTYAQHGDTEIVEIDFDESTGRVADTSALDDKTAALVVQSPNFFGCVEDLESLAAAAHAVGALFVVVVTEAISFGMLKTPGACGADIVVGDGQSWGVPMSFGGPHLGLFATQDKFVRQMPGRLCGVAYDKNGKRGFVLTLSTREQHIRREKATSNICTNQGLIALAATIYMETMGKKGLQEVAMQNAQKAAYAKQQIAAIEGYSIPFSSPTFNEFVVRGPRSADEMLEAVRGNGGIIGGISLSKYYAGRPNEFLVCVTETNSKAQIDALVTALAAA